MLQSILPRSCNLLWRILPRSPVDSVPSLCASPPPKVHPVLQRGTNAGDIRQGHIAALTSARGPVRVVQPSISVHQLLLPPAGWCPISAVWTAQAGYDFAISFKRNTLVRTSFGGLVRQLGHEQPSARLSFY